MIYEDLGGNSAFAHVQNKNVKTGVKVDQQKNLLCIAYSRGSLSFSAQVWSPNIVITGYFKW